MIQFSVVIITLNEEKNLRRCLASVKSIADEIVVVDSGSTDATADIAQEFGARIIVQPFLGYVAQKNFASAQAKNDWVLNLDADEELSPELYSQLQQAEAHENIAAFRVSRLTNYCGQWIRHSGWYPDEKIRLYHRQRGTWQGEQIHEHWEPGSPAMKIIPLKGHLYHYSYYTISDHLKQIEKFSEILARTAVNNGKNASVLQVWLAPKWKFITYYFIRLGFLDGYAGFLVCKLSAVATLAKYSKIRQYAAMKKKGVRF